MNRSLAFPITALAVVAVAALANYAVYQAGVDWFVGVPSISVVYRNVGSVVVLLYGGWFLLPREGRRRSTGNLLLITGLLLGIGSAMQFRLGHDAPPRLSNDQVLHVVDSVRLSMRGAPEDSVRRSSIIAVRRGNSRLRRDFESSRIDTRLARSLERAYGATPITREVLDSRPRAVSDSLLFRLLPIAFALVLLAAVSRYRLTGLLSSRWQWIGVGGAVAVGLFTFLYLRYAGGIRGASFAPQEILKLLLPIAWGGLLIRYRDAFQPELRERFTASPMALWLYILLLLSAPLVVFVLVRDFGQFLVIGIAQTLLLAWFTRSPLYVVLFSAGFLASGVILLSGSLPLGVTLSTALAIVVGAVAVIGWLERFRRRDVLWTSASLVLGAYVATAAVVTQLPFVAHMLATPRARFMLWADLYSRHGDAGWWDRARQVIEALYSFDAGGLFGRGLGQGTPFLIPNANSDFIFAAIVEELGIAGGIIVVVAFAAIVAIGLRIANDLGKETFAGLAVAGFTLLLGAQALIHIAGTMNLLPMTGITLPILSSGMSSMVVTLGVIGLIAGLSAHREEKIRISTQRN